MSDVRASTVRRQEERSTRRAAHLDDHSHAFLSEFAPLCETHHLIPTDLDLDSSLSTDDVFSSLADGRIEPILDSNDEPSWTTALTSPEQEYWIARGRDKLKSLEDLKVFILVPRSKMPHGQRPLKGKLVCK